MFAAPSLNPPLFLSLVHFEQMEPLFVLQYDAVAEASSTTASSLPKRHVSSSLSSLETSCSYLPIATKDFSSSPHSTSHLVQSFSETNLNFHPPPLPPLDLALSSNQLFQAHLENLSLVLGYLLQNIEARSCAGVAWALEELSRLDGRVATPVLDVLTRLAVGEGASRMIAYVCWAGMRVKESSGGLCAEIGWARWVEVEVDHLLARILDSSEAEEKKALLDVLDSFDPERAEDIYALLFSTEFDFADEDRKIRLEMMRSNYSFSLPSDPSLDFPPDLTISQLASLFAPL
ncbi:hypothetical protein BDY24DRAFT_370719 [Mrakia frigida]|uniref:uncharacterized protein n=1 Tax=Mrakia frigida TaxID=29902 RepID=UPI003FCC2351